MNYQQAVEWLEKLANPERYGFGADFARRVNLETTRALMADLGNPEQRLRAVHIAGTKGKGTVAAMIESVARAAGHSTGLFTSPHLISWRERIRLDGEQISEERVAALATRVRPPTEALESPQRSVSPTFFEVCTAMAFLAFAEDGADVSIIEAGLGGRLDATNVLTPTVSVITTLGIDHSAILGDTLSQVAGEKAGIIKPGVPVVSAAQEPEGAAVIEETAASRSASLHVAAPFEAAGKITPVRPEDVPPGEAPRLTQPARGSFAGETIEVALPLLGEHQLINAGVATTACELLAAAGVSITAQAVVRGLESVSWRARVELVEARPWLVLDCAHNRESARALMQALRRHLEFERLIVVLGLSHDKEAEAIAEELAEAEHVIVTRVDTPRAMPTDELRERTEGYWRSLEVVATPPQALAHAREMAGERDLICVTGSVYLAGELMQQMGKTERGNRA